MNREQKKFKKEVKARKRRKAYLKRKEEQKSKGMISISTAGGKMTARRGRKEKGQKNKKYENNNSSRLPNSPLGRLFGNRKLETGKQK